MSHRDDCTDRYTARREGERAFDYGRGSYSNPYRGEDGCEEAANAWRRGFEEREEERAREQREERRHAEARAEQEAYEAAMYEQEMEAAAAEAEYAAQLEADAEAAYYEGKLDEQRNGDHEEPPPE